MKITSLAGAYWRGDEKRNQLVRVYGITFPKKKMLDGISCLEEARSATTANSARRWNSLLSRQMWAPDFLFGYRRRRPS